MKTHFAKKNGKTGCNRDRDLGINRTRSIYIISIKDFVNTYKINPKECCIKCVMEYNKLNKLANKDG